MYTSEPSASSGWFSSIFFQMQSPSLKSTCFGSNFSPCFLMYRPSWMHIPLSSDGKWKNIYVDDISADIANMDSIQQQCWQWCLLQLWFLWSRGGLLRPGKPWNTLRLFRFFRLLRFVRFFYKNLRRRNICDQSVRVGPAGRPPTRSGCQLPDVELVGSHFHDYEYDLPFWFLSRGSYHTKESRHGTAIWLGSSKP